MKRENDSQSGIRSRSGICSGMKKCTGEYTMRHRWEWHRLMNTERRMREHTSIEREIGW